jgi:hypothetical protein
MITTQGRKVVTRLFGGQVATLATSLSVGTGTTAEALTDVALRAEVLNVPITSISVDEANNRVIYKATLPPAAVYSIYEVGLFYEVVDRQNRTMVLNGLDTTWTNASLVAGPGRANNPVARIAFSANGTTNAELAGVTDNLSDFQATDFVLLSFTGHANLSSLRVRLGTDASNYFEFAVTSPVAGYNNVRVARSTATTVGIPTWDSITYLAIRPSGSAAGAGSVDFDRIGFEQNPSPNSILVARKVLATPYLPDQFIESEIEYSHGVTA